MVAHAQQVIDVSRCSVTSGLRTQRVVLQVHGPQALPVSVIAARSSAFALLIERGLAVPLAVSA
jgi:hypothetical protein